MRTLMTCAMLLALGAALGASEESWDAHNGEQGAELIGSDWIGTPLSLDDVRGNVVVLAFWNADIPC